MNNVYIIGEIGQNHNGSVELAKVIVDLVSKPVEEELFHLELNGIDAVKLTKRDLRYELSDSQMNRPYEGVNSFGKTYGEHREVLELSDEEHYEVYKHAKASGLGFVETFCAPSCTSMLKYFEPDYLKVASRDLTNLPLLEVLAETNIPIIVSTGMAGDRELNDAVDTITKYHNDLTILHCVSEYPTRPENVNLNTIKYLQNNYGDYRIGYSDHTIGIATPVAAVAMGAEVIEKHITLDRRMKGTDQAGSLGPDGVHRMVRDIRMLERSMGKEEIFICDNVKSSQEKLERSIATNRVLQVGETIKEEDLHMLSPGDGFRWASRNEIIGKTIKTEIPANEIIYSNLLES